MFEVDKAHLPDVYAYADDTQLCLSFKHVSEDNQTEAVDAVQECIEDIRACMAADQLKLNEDKTGTQQQLDPKENLVYTFLLEEVPQGRLRPKMLALGRVYRSS